MSGINIHAQEVQEQQLNSDGHDFILAPNYKRGGGGVIAEFSEKFLYASYKMENKIR